MRQFEHATPMDQAESLAISVGHALDLVIKAKGWAVLAVSGGKSPLPMFERLRYRPIRWDAVTVTLVDERAVPPDHADSNGALVRDHLLREGAGVAAWVPLIRDEAEAAGMLRRLRGQTHTVFTGVCVRTGDRMLVEHEATYVTFSYFSDRFVERYVASGEPMDKAGAYAAQGRGALVVARIEGDYWNVVGLPLNRLARMLNAFDIDVETFWPAP